MERTHCVLCNSYTLTHLYTLKDYPVTPSPSEAFEDEFQDSIFVYCLQCGCSQLKILIDPVKLYSNSHNSTANTPTWKEHHKLFAEFITENISHSSILEIGGNAGILYNEIYKEHITYTILDICDAHTRPPEIPFIKGNCETFDYTGHPCIVLSHTFEHLYHPRNFIDTLRRSNVASVFISIPNMNYMCDTKNISVLNNEHTFFLGSDEILYLFSQFGYICSSMKPFRNHSVFYHFVSDPSCAPIAIKPNIERALIQCEIVKEYQAICDSIVINTPCFICPAGHYGQKLYYYLRRYSSFIEGFIDNDTSKQGKRLYGTLASVYSPNILQIYKDKHISIILYAGPYTEELKKQLNLLHPSISYIGI
jgi:hypothetical protein